MTIPSRALDPKTSLIMAVAGMVLAAIGITVYVFEPIGVAQAVFVVGVVLFIIGYAMLNLSGRRAAARAKALADREDREGFYYILDEDYSAPVGDAVIIDLREE